MKKLKPTCLLLFLLPVLTMGFWTSCEKYNSESVGSTFYPANSVVRLFTHPVYVEFSQDGARVWGPYTSEVDYSVDGTHVSLRNTSDSLALFVYGYPANNDEKETTDCSLTIESAHDYALYLNKLTMRSQQQPAIRSASKVTCYMVLPKNSKNELYSVAAPSVLEHQGKLVLTGDGELTLTNSAPASVNPVALEVRGGLHCQNELKLSLKCSDGDALRVSDGPMRSSLGTWTFEAGKNAISNTSDSIVLIAGKYSGVAYNGKFINNGIGAVIRQAIVQGLSGAEPDLLDIFELEQKYDSTLVSIVQHLDTIVVEADSTLSIARLHSSTSMATFTPHKQMKSPWIVLSDETLEESDTLVVNW